MIPQFTKKGGTGKFCRFYNYIITIFLWLNNLQFRHCQCFTQEIIVMNFKLVSKTRHWANISFHRSWWIRGILITLFCSIGLLFLSPDLQAQASQTQTTTPGINVTLSGIDGEGDLGVAIQIVFLMTLLTLAPSILMMMTAFTRIIIVLGFVRNAVGVQSAPSNQIIVGIALFLTLFVMSPILDRINEDALQPYINEEINSTDALSISTGHLKSFMLAQARESDIEFFLGLSGSGPTG